MAGRQGFVCQHGVVDLGQPCRQSIQAVELFCASPRRRTHPRACCSIDDQFGQRIGQRIGVAGLDDATFDAVTDQSGGSADRRPDYGESGGHRLDDRDRLTLQIGGQYEDVGTCQSCFDLVAELRADQRFAQSG